jgi:hypothetical protein
MCQQKLNQFDLYQISHFPIKEKNGLLESFYGSQHILFLFGTSKIGYCQIHYPSQQSLQINKDGCSAGTRLSHKFSQKSAKVLLDLRLENC